MSDKPISDLRRRMIADMTIRSFGEKTQRDYIRQVEAFASFLGRSPDTATSDDIRRFQFSQVEQGAQPPKMNAQASALRFFFITTLGRADLAHQLARTHYPRKLPRILTPDQVAQLIEAAPGPGLKHKAALSVAYGAGLRGCEVVMLRVGDIDSQRMLIRVEMGNFLLPVRVLSKLFRRLMLTKLAAAHAAGQLQFFGVHAHLTDAKAFAAFLAPLRRKRWFVYSKRPFAGPKAVLAYLSRYTHRVAISNRRLIAFDGRRVTFKVKDYRIEGPGRYTTMTLDVDEFIRRFLIHVLPKGFHRIRHYGLFAGSNRAETIKDVRKLLNLAPPPAEENAAEKTGENDPEQPLARPCPCCGGRMFIIETFEPGRQPRH